MTFIKMPGVLDTYLSACLHNGKLARWPDKLFPIGVYIAPFHWYEAKKQAQADVYRQMVFNALNAWRAAAAHKITYQIVTNRRDSNLDIAWRRVDRRSLGHCKYLINDLGVLYSAEIEIGISDGRVHQEYNHPDEVYHTILHEVGHALGLIGHSDHPQDIMYTPHQYGICALSERDKLTIEKLYSPPEGHEVLESVQALEKTILSDEKTPPTEVLNPIAGAHAPDNNPQGLDLETQQRLLDYQGRFLLATQPKKPPRK
jgi:predicted Zn-dependent protease